MTPEVNLHSRHPYAFTCLHTHTPVHPNIAVVSQGFLKTWQQQPWGWPPAEGPTVALDPLFFQRKGNGMYVFCTYIHNHIYILTWHTYVEGERLPASISS